MDAPLVLTAEINPKEIDDEAHCIELVSSYPLEFYRACERYAWPYDVKLPTVASVLGKEQQFYLPITISGTLFAGGNTKTTYIRLESVPEKVRLEFGLHDKLRSVDKRDAAERLILSHFIPDLYGNLRSFSRQEFRCVGCNFKYRRVPLIGKCPRCGGNLLLTINKGGIQKYLQITKEILLRYKLPDYLSQRISLIEKEISNIFEDEKEKQLGLSDFV
jgi:DNA polymerase II large subunit